MTATRSFLQTYCAEIRGSYGNDFQDNYDKERFGPLSPASSRSNSAGRSFAKKALLAIGLGRVSSVVGHLETAFSFVAPWLPQLEKLHSLLADEESRKLLIKVMAFRSLGHQKIRLPLNTVNLARGVERIEALASETDQILAPSVFSPSGQYALKRIDLSSLGLPMLVYGRPSGVFRTFSLQQYRCQCLPTPIEASSGDYVLDGGGCWGDTALYFAEKVGQNGRVFSFEFVPKNLEIMQKTVGSNPSLSCRIEIVRNALWSKTGENLHYQELGPGSRLVRADEVAAPTTVRTMSIDGLVAERNLPRLDFIKLDIEGAELNALQGAKHALQRFAPKLAICIYHRIEDFFSIPDYLDSLNLGYRFYLRHFTIHSEETVLFAIRGPVANEKRTLT